MNASTSTQTSSSSRARRYATRVNVATLADLSSEYGMSSAPLQFASVGISRRKTRSNSQSRPAFPGGHGIAHVGPVRPGRQETSPPSASLSASPASRASPSVASATGVTSGGPASARTAEV